MSETFAGKAPLSELLELVGSEAMQVQRYSVTGVLGEGGMGKVYLGFDETLGREVAIKVLAETDESHQLAERFYREAKTMAALSHPNIIKIMDYSGAKARRQFLIMERLRGATLQNFVNHAPLSEIAAIIIGHELASALAHAHSVGVLHRDLKPENVYIEPNGRVVLIDFGLAKGLMSESTRKTFVQSKTKILGTPLFGSPEQFSGADTLTALADLFSLGATLYYATSQVYPFRADDLFELLDKVRSEPHLPLQQLVAVSDAFASIIDRCLHKKPKDRYASGEELEQIFLELLQNHKVGAPGPALKAALGMHVDKKRKVLADTMDAPVASQDSAGTEETRVGANRDTQVSTQDGTTRVGMLSEDGQTRISRHDPFANTRGSVPVRRVGFAAAAVVALIAVITSALLWRRGHGDSVAAVEAPSVGGGVDATAMPSAPTPAVAAAAVVPVAVVPVAVVPVGAPPVAAAPVATHASLRLIVSPWAKVKVDGVARGTTPSLRALDLSVGSHEVELLNPLFPVKRMQVEVPAAGTVLDLDMAAK